MSSYYRRHNGRSRPPPARNRPGLHHSSAPPQSAVDPNYLAFLRSQAAQLNSQISALSGDHRVTPSTSAHPQYTTAPRPPSDSYLSSSTSRHYRSRNPSREGSKWKYYAVKNGVEGDDVYSSWHQAHPYCWDPKSQYFFSGCFCKGFDDYDLAWDFLLGVQQQEQESTVHQAPIPDEPPEIYPIPSELPTAPEPPIPPTVGTEIPTHVSPEHNDNDDHTMASYDYNAILKRSRVNTAIPERVTVQDSLTAPSQTTAPDNATPFLSASSNKALPKYSGKPNEDITEFIYKLNVFLKHPSIGKCHLNASTNDTNAEQSRNLAALLSLCLHGHAISSFIDNPLYEDKGIEMLNHLMELKHPTSKTSASMIYTALTNQHIRPKESFEEFAKRLRIMYKTCTRGGLHHDEGFLIRCFMQGLDSNFDHTREMIDIGALSYYEKTLNEVLVLVNEIKLAKITHGTWINESAAANATAGQQGARRPAPSSNAPTKLPVSVDPNIPEYLYKPVDLSYTEVKSLLERYSCPICRRNNHALHNCNAMKRVYDIRLRNHQLSQNTSNTTTTTPSTASTSHPIAANRASTPVSLPDEAARYDGFESVARPPPDSDSDDSAEDENVTAIKDSMCSSKINDTSNPYSSSTFCFKHNVGSARRSNVALPHTACFRLSSNATNEYPIIIDSGATHHMWNDGSAFIQFKYLNNCYVTLANNFKILIKGQGSIQLKINGYLLHIHDVYLVPTLQFSLYSVKKHRKNTEKTLNAPVFLTTLPPH